MWSYTTRLYTLYKSWCWNIDRCDQTVIISDKDGYTRRLSKVRSYVALIFDEMKIKEGIVYTYDKHECKVVGFVDVGSVNNMLCLFEQSLIDGDDEETNPIVAKHTYVGFYGS